MECNRDEALRAREIAEKKFAVQDFSGAKKFVLKAQQLYPALEGVPQMLAVMDVHSVAQVKVGGNETDWYGILQVEPQADDSLIKRQYRKLALLLHPDKNKSVGAEPAFKLIGEAFGVLSDKAKRALHDMKRGIKAKVAQMQNRVSETMKSQYPVFQAQYQAAAQATPGPGPQAPHPSLTFWTSCPVCRMQYQYLRTYLNFQLLCQKCNKLFLAKDINANGANTYTWMHGAFDNNAQQQAGPVPPPRKEEVKFPTFGRGNGATGTDTVNGFSHSHGPSYAPGAANKEPGVTFAAAAAANLVQETFQRVRKDRVEAERELKRKEKELEKAQRLQEKEALKKAREEAKIREVLERMMSKEAKRKAAEKAGLKKRSGKRRRKEEEEGDDDEEEEDEKLADGTQPDSSRISTRKMNPRRSSRNRRSVTYKVGGSDDDLESPESKKRRITLEGGDFCKGKSVIDDDEDDDFDEDQEQWINGRDGDDEVSRRDGYVKEGSSGSASAMEMGMRDSLKNLLAEKFRRDLAAQLRKTSSAMGESVKVTPSFSKLNNETKMESLNGDNLEQNQGSYGADLFDKIRKAQLSETERFIRPDIPFARSVSPTPSVEAAPIEVIDSDYHKFDDDRTEAHVTKDQYWAIYDETDGMPRFYCKINRVRQDPFTVNGHWLEFPPAKKPVWLQKHDLSPGTGEFKLGDAVEFDQINLFSHLMTAKKFKTIHEIYPKRFEVWAIYRDYDKELPNSKTDERVQFRYDMVEVKSDFSMVTRWGSVVALEKMEGYKSLWRPVGDVLPMSVVTDLKRFSHRVPSVHITEKEIPGVPADCLELDPASTPAEEKEI